ncbi:MAG TPA: periplasmic heavy metal sensor [Kofleriaceae bacterium]
MSRLRTTFKIVIPSMLVGGLMFGFQFGHAAGGGDEVFGFWPATADVGSTNAVPKPPKPPRRGPMPPTPPTPPTPAPHPHGAGGGISISVNGNKVQIHGIDAMVQGQLEAVRQMIRNNPNIPKDLRDKIFARMDKVKGIVDKRVKNLKVDDLDRLEEELEEMGQELEQAMEGLEEDLEKLGVKLGKDFAGKLGKAGKLKIDLGKNKHLPDPDVDVDVDDDDDDDVDTIPMSPDVDDEDMRDAIGDLKDLALSPNQKQRITKLAADSDRNVAEAKRQLDAKSDQLEAALANANTSDAAIARMVDEISAHEAAIRKARLLAWVNARRVLDDSQRKKIEAAAKRTK